MMLTIVNRQRARKINVRALKKITATLLAELAGPAAILEINLVGPLPMAKVNQAFLQHDGPTDVITFDYREELPGARGPAEPHRKSRRPEDRAPGALHGELFICPEVAVAQSREFGTDWRAELVRYVIHGLLHLLGHDDREPAARRHMKRVESRLLRDIGRRFALSKL